MRTGTSIGVSGVDFSYGKLQVLFDISLDVAAGEALALLGTNGAGKSTLLKVMSGLERPDRGTVTIDGKDVTATPAEQLADDGLVLIVGGKAIFPDMTVDDNLEIMGHTAGVSSETMAERLDVVFETFPRLAERRRQRAGTMSGGEQQQLAVSKALLVEPSVLCIDELSLGLAPVVVAELLEVVRAIHDLGVTLVVVEQSLNIAADLCDRAVFLEKGEVRFEGGTDELLERGDIARAVFLGGH